MVTGGAQGLGLGITRMLAENGAKVVIFDINLAKGTEVSATLLREGYIVSFQKVDVSDEASVISAFEYVSKEHGQVDIVVNCAGIVGPHAIKGEDVDVKDFDKVYEGINSVHATSKCVYGANHFSVNVRGSFLITKHSLKLMKPRNYGRILLIASIAGKEVNLPINF